MARAKKNRKTTANFYLDKEVFELLEQYPGETGIPKTTVMEKALQQHLKNFKEHNISGGYIKIYRFFSCKLKLVFHFKLQFKI